MPRYFIDFVSANCGAGKSHGACRYITENLRKKNFLYVAPSLQLVSEIEERLRSMGVALRVITSETLSIQGGGMRKIQNANISFQVTNDLKERLSEFCLDNDVHMNDVQAFGCRPSWDQRQRFVEERQGGLGHINGCDLAGRHKRRDSVRDLAVKGVERPIAR